MPVGCCHTLKREADDTGGVEAHTKLKEHQTPSVVAVYKLLIALSLPVPLRRS